MFHPSSGEQDPVAIARGALEAARRSYADVLIGDTAA
jgi:signal recognition particle subunit SRP54